MPSLERKYRRNPPGFIRKHIWLLSSALFSLSTAVFLSHFLGYFSTFLVYLPAVLICVPFKTVHDILNWKTWRTEGFYRKTGFALWCAYILLLGQYPTNPNTVTPTKASPGYYIAANLYNNEAVLPTWTREMNQLITHLGEQNVFVSIYESNSQDNTAAILKKFRDGLDERGVANRIVMEKGVRGHFGLNSANRINYMADIRNKVLEPLRSMDPHFSKILFFNDVYFDWRDALELLNTKDGEYDLACAMDFDGIGLYDIWVTRDSCGRPTKEIWPYFSSDKRAVRSLKRMEPIEVASCWNGIAAFDASWFHPATYNVTTPPPTNKPTRTGDFLPPLPLEFRGSSECVSSECFIISMDLHFWNTPARPRIYMNPRVKVAYEKLNYVFHVKMEDLRLAHPWRLVWQDWIGWKMLWWVSDAIWLKEDKCRRNYEGFIEAEHCH
ncbi:glycosyltransferase family 69 protein [Cylindrobasidium torrendii FP15055 ss-10]|uniref:Glycosyltransferase family 69 protein n=1 Tax=Cylindrobasidium torrendii FP15055 ss-10 TaxID=1314674 RepID=A0A0D7BEQ8_9AGAR|nr:glycosyltransferase family 69 protein [Cylindrobasidium torrendii FP15055 ss-10]